MSSNELRRRIVAAEAELQVLREQLAQAEATEAAEAIQVTEQTQQSHTDDDTHEERPPIWKWPLQADEYERYARQLILPGVGVEGQRRLRAANVVIVGAGGLGCPAAIYLAGAGVGHMTLVDGDVVEPSNLHRQVGHTTGRVGQYKVDSLVATLRQLNPAVRFSVHRTPLTPANATAIIRPASAAASPTVVLDCTDHPAVRYLVSDACVRAGVPLVSAAALRTDGQLAVLNWPVNRGPCYRCVFPRPPPAASQTSCAEGGVLGPAVGVMGVLQALEAIRIVVAGPPDEASAAVPPPSLLLFSAGGAAGLGPPTFRSVRLKGRRADCFACAPDAPLKTRQLTDVEGGAANGAGETWPDYVRFCGGGPAAQTILQPGERVSVAEYSKVVAEAQKHWLLDVREKEFYNLGCIDGAVNVPFSLVQRASRARPPPDGGTRDSDLPAWLPPGLAEDAAPIYLVCRVGNDSQVVARQLKQLGLDKEGERFIGDICGGVLAWKREVDSTMPFA